MNVITAWLLVLSVSLLFNSSARCEVLEGVDQSKIPECLMENKLDYNNDDKFTISLTSLASKTMTAGNETDLYCFRHFLDEINLKELSLEQYKQVLFLLAETDFRLGKFEKAYQHYVQLKLLIKDKSDLMLQDVDQRLNESRKEVRSARKRNDYRGKLQPIEKGIYKYFLVSLFLFLLLIFAGKFFAVWNRWKYFKFERSTTFIRDPIETKLIEFEKMRGQDGRASKSAVDDYNHEKTKSPPPVGYDERTSAARLIVEGHKMIVRVNTLAPFPIAAVSKIPMLNKLPYFWQYTVPGFIFIAFQAVVSVNFIAGYNVYERLVGLFLVAALIISSLTCLRIMAKATINALDEIVSMLEAPAKNESIDKPPTSVLKIEKNVDFLFRSPWQFFIVVVIFFIIIVKIFVNSSNVSPEIVIPLFFALLILLIACPIIWLLIGSVYVLNDICSMDDLAINPLSPLKTMGLEKWTSVIGTYGLTSSIVLSFGCSIPVITGFINKGVAGDWFWFAIILPLLFFYWIYPYLQQKK